jgi:hypothetical protein
MNETRPKTLREVKEWLTIRNAPKRFRSGITLSDEATLSRGKCWVYPGRVRDGYPTFGIDQEPTHVLTARLRGLCLEQGQYFRVECNNLHCCNPWHLEQLEGRASDQRQELLMNELSQGLGQANASKRT